VTIALVTHVSGSSSGGAGFTTSSVDTTTANLLVAVIGDLNTGSTISDSKSNTWTNIFSSSASGVGYALYYVKNASVGSGHTFTLTASGQFPALCVAAFSGADTTAPLDQTNSLLAGNNSSLQPGSITPAANNEVAITAVATAAATSMSIDSSYSITDQVAFSGGTHFGAALAYIIQTSASATNPTWTSTGGNMNGVGIASFKVGVSAQDTPELRGRPFGLRGQVQMHQLLAQ
jgi:hypothetical protein